MKFKKFSLALLFFAINIVLLFTFVYQKEYTLKVGQIAKEDIKASKDMENKIETEKLIKRASEQVQPIFKINPTIQLEIKSQIESFFNEVYKIKGKEIPIDEMMKNLKSLNSGLSDESLKLILSSDEQKLDVFKKYIFEIINQIMNPGIQDEEIASQKESIGDFLNSSNGFSENEKLVIIEIINVYLKPNKFLDIDKTQEKVETAKESVQKVMIYKGETIIYKGEFITPEKIELLNSLGFLNKNSREDILIIIAIVIFICISEYIFIVYCKLFDEDLIKSNKNILLIVIIMGITLLMASFLKILSAYIIPIATCSMLISILLNPQIAIISNIIISVYTYILVCDDTLLVASLISGTYASFVSCFLNQRRDIIFYGVKVGALNFLIILSLGFINSISLNEQIINAFLMFLGAFISSIFVVGTLPMWEYYFDILTTIKLLEYSNQNNELLKRMLIETPGTYHHSIIVGNLAERACDKIRANSLLARVASYYHDVGKLSRPFYFKENQMSMKNPHDRLKPITSAKIIKRHVEYGVTLAKKYKLPVQIINILREHHGTTLIAYFYYKSKEMAIEVNEKDFRYDGPKPQTKEAAVVMLADSVEAAIRSIKEPTKEKIEDMVNKVVSGKLSDNQLDRCDLTFKDIDSIKEAFLEVVLGMFHERIEYPDEGGHLDADTDRQ